MPVDPRDLFRGEYVRLGYGVNSVPMRLLEGPRPYDNAAFYVVLAKQADASWQPVKMSGSMPRETDAARIVLKARASYWPAPDAKDASVRVRYGIESYFLPEGKGREMETLAREKKLATLVAVDGGGNAAIKGLLVDGVLKHEEPLF